MSATPFQIPGLGLARPNEDLPAENFAPDLLAAAASIGGDDGPSLGVTDAMQWERQEDQKQESERTAQATMKTQQPTTSTESHTQDSKNTSQTVDSMEVDDKSGEAEAAKLEPSTGTGSDLAPAENALQPATMQDAPSSPGVADALEAALDGLLSATAGDGEQALRSHQQQQGGQANGNQDVENPPAEGEHPEWEADSSPYESSDSDTTDSSSDEDSEDEGGYTLLGVEETARLLMAGDNDGDGDGSGKAGKGPGSALRTKNEIADEIIPKPDIIITPEMEIQPLGAIEAIVDTICVIKAKMTGELQVLDTGSVLCLEDRTIIGVLAETLGNVRNPMYTVAFANEEEIKELGLEVGKEIFHSVQHAQYVFTQALKGVKGSDASNLHDEEVAADEMEFSDDEKEAEHKRQLKMKKRGGKAGRGGRDQSGQQPHPLSNVQAGSSNLNYDEEEDGPYKPLARPASFGHGAPPSLPALPPKPEGGFSQPRGGHGHRGSFRGGRGDGRNRGNRGYRGGDRKHGRGRGGFQYDGAASPEYSNSQSSQPQNPHLPPPPYRANPPPASPSSAPIWPPAPTPYPPAVSYGHSQPPQPQVPPPPQGAFNFNYQAWNQPPAHYSQQTRPPQPHQPTPTGYPQVPVPPTWPGMGSQTPPAGAYVNPAFFGGLQHGGQQPQAQQPQQGQHQAQHQAQQYWAQHGSGYGHGQK